MIEETIVAAPSSEEIPVLEGKEQTPFTDPLKKSFMRKQIMMIVVPIFIIVLGVLGYFSYQTLVKTKEESVSVTQTESVPLNLALASPLENSVITDSEITIRGTTLPNTPVLIYTENADNSVESDGKGNFEGKINLSEGINTLTVTAFGGNGEEKTLAYNLVYDNQVKGVKNPPGQTNKDEGGKKAVVGTVESTTTNSVITEKNKKTTEVEVNKNTKIINQNKKEVKLNSLKKSDFAAIITDDETATSSRQLKKALKIYVRDATASAQAQPKRKAISGVIQSISGNLITLTHQIQTDRIYQLYTSTSTAVKIKDLPSATIADLKAGLRIAAVGDLNEEGQLVAKRIHVIPGKATGVFNKYPTPTATPSGNITVTPTLISSPTPTIETSLNP